MSRVRGILLVKFTVSIKFGDPLPSLKLTAGLPLKMDGWKMIHSLWSNLGLISAAVSFREG